MEMLSWFVVNGAAKALRTSCKVEHVQPIWRSGLETLET